MQYLLTLYSDESAWPKMTEEQQKQGYAAYMAYSEALKQAGALKAGLAAINRAATDSRLAEYQPYWAARAELLARTGARDEAHHAYDVAIGMERETSVRQFLEQRRALLDNDVTSVRRIRVPS